MQKPDYAKWLNCQLWSLGDAACVLSGLEPPAEFDKELLTSGIPAGIYNDLKDAIDLEQLKFIERDGRLHRRRVKPDECVVWALSRGYDIPDPLRMLARDPSKTAQTDHAPAPGSNKPLSRHRAQEQVIQDLLAEKVYDATNLPRPQEGKEGVKKEIRLAAAERHDLFPPNSTTFNKAWERLRSSGAIRETD